MSVKCVWQYVYRMQIFNSIYIKKASLNSCWALSIFEYLYHFNTVQAVAYWMWHHCYKSEGRRFETR
jgi:hypothetical protein